MHRIIIIIPCVCAIVAIFVLHRRYVHRLRYEDAHDKHKSLDFGMEVVRANPEMGEKPHKRGGLSLDVGNSPYLLPPGLHDSKESLRSPSLITSPEDDKYRLAAHSDAGSLRSFRSNPRWGNDDASSFVGSTRQMPTMADEMDQGLLQNASGMSRSPPVGGIPTSPLAADPILNEKYSSEPKAMDKKHSSMDSSPPDFESVTDSSADLPKELESSVPSAHNDEMFLGSYGQQKAGNLTADKAEGNHVPNETSHTTTRSSLNGFDFGTGNNDANSEHHDIPIIQETTTDTPPVGLPRLSLPMSETSDYGDEPKSNLSPSVNVSEAEDQPRESEDNHQPVNNRATQAFTKFDEGFDPHRLTVGIRPLPPEDPSDNAEQRANRIRSFYKEYFDDSRGVPEEYYEDFGSEFYDDAAVYDPYTGDYVVGPPKPFAQPMARRAMTPPPRFQGPPRPLHSAAGMRAPGPRAFSSASARLPANQGPRKPAPPPEPLHVLPSPHLIKDDMSVLPVDYAPAKTFKERQEGRPDSPHGGLRPFTPSARSHTPLVSSFDDLAAIPSPHAMRKSGLYTTLDFAPPARFRNDTGSDAGSIRSNRTGISAVHTHNIRTGAYRVSRLPPGVVGTKDDLFASLKPSMDLNR
ncbi:hypothetical protein UA08_05781 [Talaromyces atroroseus]|uniref:Uncharacterized protein n=1 Tax=Talaromyces atroroseus TaxID=1441469 RepID=A0A225ATE2_TALAT|nr:hypothetical protein UA08_05781 [Talaromyces atroroseus]OKL58869.1 hypothetical protein UA08_05781 [Talaromyces atroroseus]